MELFGGFRFGFFGSSGLCICFGCFAFVLQGRDQAADRRLQQADDFADEFLAGLDAGQGTQLFIADIDLVVDPCAFEQRALGVFTEFLDDLSGNIGKLR